MRNPDSWPNADSKVTEQPLASLAVPKILTQAEIEDLVPEGEAVTGEVALQIINSYHQQKVEAFLNTDERRDSLQLIPIDMSRWMPWLRVSRQPDGTIDYGAIQAPFIRVEKDADPSFQAAVEAVFNDSLFQTNINAWGKNSDLGTVADTAYEIEKGNFEGVFFISHNTFIWSRPGQKSSQTIHFNSRLVEIMSQPEFPSPETALVVKGKNSSRGGTVGTLDEYGDSIHMIDFLTNKKSGIKHFNTILGFLTPPLPFHVSEPKEVDGKTVYYLEAGPVSDDIKEIANGVDDDNMIRTSLGSSPELPSAYLGHEFVQHRLGVNTLTPRIVAGVVERTDGIVASIAVSNGTEFSALNSHGNPLPIERYEGKTPEEKIQGELIRLLKEGRMLNFSTDLHKYAKSIHKIGEEHFEPDLSELTPDEIETSYRLMLTKHWGERTVEEMNYLRYIVNREPSTELITEACERCLNSEEHGYVEAGKLYITFPHLVSPETVKKLYLASPHIERLEYRKKTHIDPPQAVADALYWNYLMSKSSNTIASMREHVGQITGRPFSPEAAAENLTKLVQSGTIPSMSLILDLHSNGVTISPELAQQSLNTGKGGQGSALALVTTFGVHMSADQAQHFASLDNLDQLKKLIELTGVVPEFDSDEIQTRLKNNLSIMQRYADAPKQRAEYEALQELLVEGKIIAKAAA